MLNCGVMVLVAALEWFWILSFEIESTHKLAMNFNLNVDFQKSLNLNSVFFLSQEFEFRFCKVNEF